MGVKNLNSIIVSPQSTDSMEAYAFRIGSYLEAANTTLLGSTNVHFVASLIPSAILSATTTGIDGGETSATHVARVLGKLISELVRKKVIEGTYNT